MTDARTPLLLVCDDDAVARNALCAGLRGAGFEVVDTDSGDDAILLARQHRPDLAMLDMHMKTGLDVAAYLRDYVGTPFVFLCGFGDEALQRQARAFGARDYLLKPLAIEAVIASVKAALAGEPQRDAATDTASSRSSEDSGRGSGRGSSGAASDHAGGQASDRAAGAMPSAVPVAIGILMERFALSLAGARSRLEHLAATSRRSVEDVADEFVARLDASNAGESPAIRPRTDPRA